MDQPPAVAFTAFADAWPRAILSLNTNEIASQMIFKAF